MIRRKKRHQSIRIDGCDAQETMVRLRAAVPSTAWLNDPRLLEGCTGQDRRVKLLVGFPVDDVESPLLRQFQRGAPLSLVQAEWRHPSRNKTVSGARRQRCVASRI